MKTKLTTSIRTLLLSATIALQPSIAPAASPSELLEKGIYTEETKGDLEGAITIYQQLVDEAKAGQSLAAQAQLRLGQCLLKKKRDPEAIAAFEKLIRDFPEEKELIAKARAYLPADIALGAVPWVDGERQQLTISLGSGLDIGTMELRADLMDSNGRKIWRVGRRMGGGGGEMLSSVDVDAETFSPVTSYWKHTLIGEASATFTPGEVTVRKTGSEDPVTVHPDKTVYDNEEFMHLMRRLPLAEGYKTTIPTLSSLGGGIVIPIVLEVTKKETLETPAGKFSCFKVPLSVAQTFWVSDDEHRYIVKFEGGGAIGTLASITSRKAGTPIAFRDDTLGVSFTTPADWVIHRQAERRKGESTIYLLDAGANADGCELNLKAADSLSASARQSARTWADEDLRANQAKELQDMKIRPDSWKSYNVSGRIGVGCVADYTERGKAKVLYVIYAVGPKTCEKFIGGCAPEQADSLKTALDAIVASYRMAK